MDVEGLRHDAPVVEECLDLGRRDGSVAHPVFDPRHVQRYLAIDRPALSGGEVADVLDEPPFYVFAIGSHNDPPAWKYKYQ